MSSFTKILLINVCILLAICLLRLISCSDLYTWRDVSQELAVEYCRSLDECEFHLDQSICVEHTSWHLCEANRTCDAILDEGEALLELNTCITALKELKPRDVGCYFLVYYGQLPPACDGLLDLKPR